MTTMTTMTNDLDASKEPVDGGVTHDAPALRIVVPAESELIVHGLEESLRPYSSRVQLLDPEEPTDAGEVDIALFDCFSDAEPGGVFTGRLPPHRLARRTVAYSWHTQQPLVEWALENGFAGYLSKALPIRDLVSALEALPSDDGPADGSPERQQRAHPDLDSTVRLDGTDDVHLTPRECEALALVCSGRTNHEIALHMHISPNSLKSYIRAAYRKIGVTTRSQAVLWGIRHGLRPPA
jgi:two-component system, NarL family, response regulator LiaR